MEDLVATFIAAVVLGFICGRVSAQEYVTEANRAVKLASEELDRGKASINESSAAMSSLLKEAKKVEAENKALRKQLSVAT